MPTTHATPHAKGGEIRKDGHVARRHGRPKGRQRAIDPERLRVVAELMRTTDYLGLQIVLSERWGVSQRTIRTYRKIVLDAARAEAAEAGLDDAELDKILGRQQLEDIRVKAMAANDFRAATAAIKLRLMISGALSPGQTYVHQTQLVVNNAAEPADDARMALAQRLALRLGAPRQLPVMDTTATVVK